MSDYNAKVLIEQGASVLRVDSDGQIRVNSGGSLQIAAGGAFLLGDNVQFLFAASTAAPSGLPVWGTPGDVFFRADEANSAGYVNTSDGTAGSVWTIFSEL